MLSNKVALITGAGSGIGEASARLCATNGAKVVLADMDMDGAKRVLGLIEEAGGSGLAFNVDVANAADCERMVVERVMQFGNLHIAVNNAGIGRPAERTGNYPIDGWKS